LRVGRPRFSARRRPEDLTEVGSAPEQTVGETERVTLQMRLNKAGLTMLAEASNRLPALLETAVTRDGKLCRSTSPALLRIDPSASSEGSAPPCPTR
jgi:hypothetical protein